MKRILITLSLLIGIAYGQDTPFVNRTNAVPMGNNYNFKQNVLVGKNVLVEDTLRAKKGVMSTTKSVGDSSKFVATTEYVKRALAAMSLGAGFDTNYYFLYDFAVVGDSVYGKYSNTSRDEERFAFLLSSGTPANIYNSDGSLDTIRTVTLNSGSRLEFVTDQVDNVGVHIKASGIFVGDLLRVSTGGVSINGGANLFRVSDLDFYTSFLATFQGGLVINFLDTSQNDLDSALVVTPAGIVKKKALGSTDLSNYYTQAQIDSINTLLTKTLKAGTGTQYENDSTLGIRQSYFDSLYISKDSLFYTADIDISASGFTITRPGTYEVIASDGSSEIQFPDPLLFQGREIVIINSSANDAIFATTDKPYSAGTPTNFDKAFPSRMYTFKSINGKWRGTEYIP